jgi:glyoxylase-like metal-dependent hydrolase (beta-lactamase superfamily II)
VDDEPDEPDPDDVDPDAAADAPDPHDEPKETLDLAFDPDVRVGDGEVAAEGPGYTVRAVHTPGHTSNHLCFALAEEQALFTGDHVMGWSTTVVSPPDGDMRAYVDSLRKVQGRADAVLWPTHGAPVTDPAPFLQAYLDHRLEREAQVLAMVRAGVTKIVDIVDVLYADVKPELHKPARRSVLAHLVKLVDDGHVACDTDRPRIRSHYTPA